MPVDAKFKPRHRPLESRYGPTLDWCRSKQVKAGLNLSVPVPVGATRCGAGWPRCRHQSRVGQCSSMLVDAGSFIIMHVKISYHDQAGPAFFSLPIKIILIRSIKN